MDGLSHDRARLSILDERRGMGAGGAAFPFARGDRNPWVLRGKDMLHPMRRIIDCEFRRNPATDSDLKPASVPK